MVGNGVLDPHKPQVAMYIAIVYIYYLRTVRTLSDGLILRMIELYK